MPFLCLLVDSLLLLIFGALAFLPLAFLTCSVAAASSVLDIFAAAISVSVVSLLAGSTFPAGPFGGSTNAALAEDSEEPADSSGATVCATAVCVPALVPTFEPADMVPGSPFCSAPFSPGGFKSGSPIRAAMETFGELRTTPKM